MKFFFNKKFVLLVLVIALWSPSQAQSQYKALLKSGEELYATDYWVDKVDHTVIRLLTNGTMTRIPRSDVRYIAPVTASARQVRTAIKRITFASKDKSVTAASGVASNPEPAASTSSTQPQPLLNPQIDEKSLQSEAERIDREREAAKDNFKKALTNEDFSLRQRARQRILDLTDERSKLLEKVKAANSDIIPAWWRWKTED